MALTSKVDHGERDEDEPSWKVLQELREYVAPHVASFNDAVTDGLRRALHELTPTCLECGSTATTTSDNAKAARRLELWWEDVRLALPDPSAPFSSPETARVVGDDRPLLPHGCRLLHRTYSAELRGVLCWRSTRLDTAATPLPASRAAPILSGEVYRSARSLGAVPVMVGSRACALHGRHPAELVSLGEEEWETGGYFIVNGVERVIRLLVLPRANHPMALQRDAFAGRGEQFSRYAVHLRCQRPDQVRSVTHTLHYLHDGTVRLRLRIRRQEFYVPALGIVRALVPWTDHQIGEWMLGDNGIRWETSSERHFVQQSVLAMLRDADLLYATADADDRAPEATAALLGHRFRVVLEDRVPPSASDAEMGTYLIRHHVLPHLERRAPKAELLLYMARKLLALVCGRLRPDNPDSIAHQQVLLPGHLWLAYLQERLEEALTWVRLTVQRQLAAHQRTPSSLDDPDFINDCISRAGVAARVGDRLHYLLATGNLSARSQLELMQSSGLSVAAERTNVLRFLSHFRCVHRGQYFATSRSTDVRRLLPESWGFLCPVHTPDGAPCGLLNHLAAPCRVEASVERALSGAALLRQRLRTVEGVYPAAADDLFTMRPPDGTVPVLLDGAVCGYCTDPHRLVTALRQHKRQHRLWCEVAYAGQRRGDATVWIFSGVARLLRPVRHLASGRIEYIGTYEQLHLRIGNHADAAAAAAGDATHAELDATATLSVLASLIPFSDMNQSPRNMYQCQMAKQAMGTPVHHFAGRFDAKLYRLLTPQRPLVCNDTEARLQLGERYGTSFNAVVAVISYTGYDMEDGMVMNRASLDRGLAHGVVYSSQLVDLEQQRHRGSTDTAAGFASLPSVGARLHSGDVLYRVNGRRAPQRYTASEPAYVDAVALAGSARRAVIRLRTPRPPVIGDKFASRHGQKGVLSAVWPAEDMPFAESGMVPDIVFNPNGFPSRMTIGMMVEAMAGKACAVHGRPRADATPFGPAKRSPQQRLSPVDDFGRALLAAGYEYHGTERLYSGYSGEPFPVRIFTGVIAWQRLRHHVADKFQVRAHGPVNHTFRQPLKGRKLGGAIRFGEMERDAALACGAAYALQDRLQHGSDLHTMYVSAVDGSLLAPLSVQRTRVGGAVEREVIARTADASPVRRVRLPYAFKYLVHELAAMNIRVTLSME
ncbi:hypothetical protein CDCA_CDCA13G3657 [Cyanidium caldarium]|uniref:DNA-directed RNA polymerase subunit beta n=1 Tax=Cyanidium caldarium TaxID=2771 RepID=A0AAV9IZ66_CYACA|nr:hypothetical protein CDCA_CDCA13G3657 [Cyanidium caldarium]